MDEQPGSVKRVEINRAFRNIEEMKANWACMIFPVEVGISCGPFKNSTMFPSWTLTPPPFLIKKVESDLF